VARTRTQIARLPAKKAPKCGERNTTANTPDGAIYRTANDSDIESGSFVYEQK